MSDARPGRTPYWPDRTALRRRRNARRVFRVAAVLVLVLPWFAYRHVQDWLRPVEPDAPAVAVGAMDAPVADGVGAAGIPRAGAGAAAGSRPLVRDVPAARTGDGGPATELAAIGRDARAGDGEAAAARLADVGAEQHRQALLADRGSAIRREAARRDLADIPGVRAAGWVDRMTVLLVMSSHGGGHPAIAEACRRLSAHGDVTGLAVRVQEVAGDRPAATALLGECRADASTRAAPLVAPSGVAARPLRAPGTAAAEEDPEAAAERRRRAEESLRILSETTPELPSAPPQPRDDP